MINYASLNDKGKMAFDCALRITSSAREGGCKLELNSITDGIGDCFVNLIISTGFKHLKNSSQYKAFCRALQDVQNYDLILKKLSDILSKDTVENFIQALLENGIQNVYRNEK